MKDISEMTVHEVLTLAVLADMLDARPDLPIEHRRMPRKVKYTKGKKRCTCGFRIRGPNHNEGDHHQRRKG